MVEVNGLKLYIGGYTQGVLEDLREFPKHDWDNVILVTGREGDGKTSFVKVCSYVLDPDVTAERWAYNAEQFEAIVDRDDLPDGANVIWDESDELAQHWANSIVQAMTRKMKRIRKKRLTIWLITPAFFDMKKYFAIFRARCLFDVYAEPRRNKETNKFEPNRGRVRFFGWEKKRELYMKGVKEWNMNAVMPNFIDSFGRVPDGYPVDEATLESRKDEAMKSLMASKDNIKTNLNQIRFNVYVNIQAKLTTKPMWKWGVTDWSEVLDIPRRTFYDYRNENGILIPTEGSILGNKRAEGGRLLGNLSKGNPPIMKGGELQ